MALSLPMVWSDTCVLHEPKGEVWLGTWIPGTETSERVTVIRAAVEAAGAPVLDATDHDDSVLEAVHHHDLIEHLRTVYPQWTAEGLVDATQHDRVVPYLFPTAGMLDGIPPHTPTGIHGLVGRYAYDTMTLVGPGTWAAARGAVDAALTAVDVVAGGAPAAYALCRPPGHHVTRAAYGGSCYLNNAAAAAEGMRRAGLERVAVVDVDAHHGNGTQAIFYDRADVLYASLHVDPGAGWFPHYVGYADERGTGAGEGTTVNVPLAPRTDDTGWLAAVESLAQAVNGFGAQGLVLSLGVDAAADDPESPLLVTADGYRGAGELLGWLGLPTVAVQEGGYHLPTLGGLVVAALEGLERGLDRSATR